MGLRTHVCESVSVHVCGRPGIQGLGSRHTGCFPLPQLKGPASECVGLSEPTAGSTAWCPLPLSSLDKSWCGVMMHPPLPLSLDLCKLQVGGRPQPASVLRRSGWWTLCARHASPSLQDLGDLVWVSKLWWHLFVTKAMGQCCA